MKILKGLERGFKGLFGTDKQGMEQVADQNQQELINLLMARSKGQNSLAEAQSKAGLQQNLANTSRGINAIGGIGASLKRKRINDLGATTGQNIAQQGAMARMAEANEAQGTLGNILAGRAATQADLSKATREQRAGLFRSLGQMGASVASKVMTGGAV